MPDGTLVTGANDREISRSVSAVKKAKTQRFAGGASKRHKKSPFVASNKGAFKNPAIPTFTLVCTIIGS